MAKTKKNKKSKKVTEEEEDMEDIVVENKSDDDAAWAEVDPPPDDDDSGDDEDEEPINQKDLEPTEAVEVDESEEPVAAAGNRRFSVADLKKLTPAEMPVIGYALASFVFFLAAVTMSRCPKIGSFRRNLDEMGDFMDNYLDSLNDVINDATTFEDDFIYSTGSFGGGLCGGYGCMSTGPYAYGICLGLFGMLMALGLFGWMRYNAHLAAQRNGERPFGGDLEDGAEEGSADGSTGAKITTDDDPNKSASELVLENNRWIFNSLLLVWAVIGWGYFTFGGGMIFANTGNGFFALWAMMIFAVWNFGVTLGHVTKEAQNSDSCVYGLTLVSLIVLIDLSANFSRYRFNKTWKGISIFALVVCVSVILYGLSTGIMAMVNKENNSALIPARIRIYILSFILFLTILTACLTTFNGPFLTTSNGYFGVWGSVIFTSMALSAVLGEPVDLRMSEI